MLPVGTIECLKVTPLISLCLFCSRMDVYTEPLVVKTKFFSFTVLELLGCHVDGVKNGGI